MENKKPKLKNQKQETFINFLTDFAFKKIFENENLLIDFLNEILGKEHKNMDHLQSEQLGRTDKVRKAIYDIYCKSEQDEYFIIEMQVTYQKHYLDRMLFYSTFPIQKSAIKGEWDYELKPVYFISIVDFEISSKKNYLNHVDFVWREATEKATDKLNFIVIELPKFKKMLNQLETRQDWWIYCIKHLGELTEQPIELHDPIFDKLFETARINNLKDEDMRKTYNKSILDYEDVRICMRDIGELNMEKGRKTGFIEVAKNMLALQYTVNDIVKVTGLPPREITALKN